jgi:integrase
MTTYYLRGRRYFVGIPTREGRWIKRATGSSDKILARSIARMIDELGPEGRREWDLLDAVATGTLDVAALFDAYRSNALDTLREQMKDADLGPFVRNWLDSIAARVAPDTLEHYELYVRSFIPEGKRFPQSALTHARIVAWLSSPKLGVRERVADDGKKVETKPIGPSTRRKYHAALSGFCDYARAVGLIERNPMREIKAPRPAPARMSYLSIDNVRALADAQPEAFRTLSLLLHATGIEVSVALALKKRDIDMMRREIRARGTKTKARDRIAKVADWAWPDVEKIVRRLLPNAPIFPSVNRWTASDKHREACAVLGIEDYQLKDSRHTYAVRAIRAGAPFEHAAAQLGHTDTTMVVRVYARFRPSESERSDWQRIATLQDEAARKAL